VRQATSAEIALFLGGGGGDSARAYPKVVSPNSPTLSSAGCRVRTQLFRKLILPGAERCANLQISRLTGFTGAHLHFAERGFNTGDIIIFN
jgi:hypothetical protein